MPDLVISIINYKTADLTSTCLSSILGKKWQTDYQIWVVDNNSEDGSLEILKKKFPKVNFIESDENLGFAGGHNLVLKKVSAKYYLILNSDTEVTDGSIDKLIEFANQENFDISGCLLLNKDNSFQPSGGDLPSLGAIFIWIAGLDDFLPFKERLPSIHRKFKSYYQGGEIGWISGAVMLIKSEAIKKIGFLDEEIFMYAEDMEFCLRAKRAGLRVGFTVNAKINHLSGGSLDDPHFRQWLGEYKGLIYIYQKYFNLVSQFMLRILIYIFTLLRIFAFAMIGKAGISKTYAKIITNI